MGGSPGLPRAPKAPPPPALPIDPAVLERRRNARSKRGKTQTLLTGPQGVVNRGIINTPTLMGGLPLGGSLAV